MSRATDSSSLPAGFLWSPMSRHPSPGPSVHNAQHGPSASSARRSRPTHPIGIAAGAEDVKYHAKYKDLKRKVKEIEAVSPARCLIRAAPLTPLARKMTDSISKPYRRSAASSG